MEEERNACACKPLVEVLNDIKHPSITTNMPEMLISTSNNHVISSINQSIKSSNPTVSLPDSLNDHLSSSDYHSFSSNDLLDSSDSHTNHAGSSDDNSNDSKSFNFNDTMSSRPKLCDKTLLNVASTVAFKWEEAPGRPIPTCTQLEQVKSCDDQISYASPLQLPPKLLQPQAHHNHMKSPCRVQPIEESCCFIQSPLRLQNPITHSPYVLHQKLKKVCRSLLRSASRSRPLHNLTPILLPWSIYPCHGSSADDEEEHILGSYNRFFFDKESPKDLIMCNPSMVPTLPISSQEVFPTLPIFDASQREDEFLSRDALRLLAMEKDHEAESSASSPWQPIMFDERGSSDFCSWTPTSIMHLHERPDDINNDEAFHDFLSSASSFGKVSRRFEDEYADETPPCSSPLPWFLDFSPYEEENHHVVNKASNKMNLVRSMALIKIKSIIVEKICKLKRRREGIYHKETSMWSPTLATYLYNNLQSMKEVKESRKEVKESLECVSEDEQASPEGVPLRISYHLPSTIRGKLISSHYLSDDELLVSPARRRPTVSDAKEEPKKPTHRLSLREQLAQFNDEYLCPKENQGYPHNALQRREHVHACKGMCKFRKTVQVLATTIKLIFVQTADAHGKKGVRRPSLSYGGNVRTLFPLPSTHK